jgi:hypothetical protein
MVYFIPKIPIWVNFGGSRNGNVGIFYYHWDYFTAIFYGRLVYFVVIWYIFPHFGMLYLEKFGNPVLDTS